MIFIELFCSVFERICFCMCNICNYARCIIYKCIYALCICVCMYSMAAICMYVCMYVEFIYVYTILYICYENNENKSKKNVYLYFLFFVPMHSPGYTQLVNNIM